MKPAEVSLRAIRDEDILNLYEWINSPEIVRLNSPFKPIHWKNHADWFEFVRHQTDREIFGIEVSNTLIGVVQLFDIHPIHRKAELSIRLGLESSRGRGFGVAAIQQCLDHARRDLNLQRVYLHVFATNVSAIRAYQKAEFKVEGTLVRDAFVDGSFVDTLIMARLL